MEQPADIFDSEGRSIEAAECDALDLVWRAKLATVPEGTSGLDRGKIIVHRNGQELRACHNVAAFCPTAQESVSLPVLSRCACTATAGSSSRTWRTMC